MLIQIPIVYSSAIRAVAYNPANSQLALLFTSGHAYRYDNVPIGDATGFKYADSPGSFYHDRIYLRYTATPVNAEDIFGQKASKEVAKPKQTQAKPAIKVPASVADLGLSRRFTAILSVFHQYGNLTGGELKRYTGNEHDEKRLTELERLGLVRRSGTTVCGVTGRNVTLWTHNLNKKRRKSA